MKTELIKEISFGDLEKDRHIIEPQVIALYNTILKEVKNFTLEEEYNTIYCRFRESIDEKYIKIFTQILDLSAKLIVHEIYSYIETTDDIILQFDPIKKAFAAKRKHFEVARNIAERTLKMYYLSNNSNKRIIDYIDEYMPENYTKDNDINFVVWYFLVCITSFDITITKK